ncbi:hypothetical protein BV20DRAFT_1035907 [Pilatotrama ljubarskyi]|nr:hypothetical protein BV20DRAFT_1035907 [Pilatotrama ljubarskyi]
MRSTPKITPGQDRAYYALIANGVPLVVSLGDKPLQGDWSPRRFMLTHGSQRVLDSRESAPSRRTVAQFFQDFLRSDLERGGTIKLKDWPSSTALASEFPDHFYAFMDAVPMASHTRLDGFHNLAAHFPLSSSSRQSFKPDLGPKMYIATRDLDEVGSTALHLDVTNAVNILMYTASEDSRKAGALWHIFLASDVDKLRGYLRSVTGSPIDKDPELAEQGVRPFVIEQHRGEAIFIPAGCPHQVSHNACLNLLPCIKIASDFVSVDAVTQSMKVREALHQERKEDILQLEATLWHAWHSIHAQLANMANIVPNTSDCAPSRLQRKRLRKRQSQSARDDQARRTKLRRSGEDSTEFQMHRYRCPHPACSDSKRTFDKLDGVLSHV